MVKSGRLPGVNKFIFRSDNKNELKNGMKGANKSMDENKQNGKKEEATVAPGMMTHDMLEKKATEKDKKEGNVTNVTRLFLDRTPED